MPEYKLLSTRGLDPSLIQEARLAGFDITEKEFISIAPSTTAEKKKEVDLACRQYLPVIFTSTNGVNGVRAIVGSARLDVCCLSGQTKGTIQRQFPSANILTEANNASELAQQVINSGVKSVIFFCGNRRREDLPGILQGAGITVQEVIVYETIETPVALDTRFDGILFFSPSAVDSFFSANSMDESTVCFAIGNTTASQVKKYSSNKIITSNSADPRAMLLSAQQHFYNSTRSNDRIKE
jgi:uroporphyrinogen-III synthase